MSLATRCTACGTVFRVVQDQLKVSDGWVRCGRCSEVFNAMPALFDLEREPTQAAPLEPAAESPAPDLPLPEPFPAAAAQEGDPRIDLDFGPDHSSPEPAAREPDDEGPAGRPDFVDARYDSQPTDPEAAPPSTLDSTTELPLLDVVEPHFIRHAQRRALWQSPRMLAWQGVAAAVLVLLLGAQFAVHFRDSVAARWPASAPLLAAWCGMTGCRLESPRRIDDVVLETSALARAASPDAFKLSVVLRNRGSLPVMMPAVDLNLTDAAGQPVARKVLTPPDFHAPAGPIRPGAESTLQVSLQTSGPSRVTGYTVEIFYP